MGLYFLIRRCYILQMFNKIWYESLIKPPFVPSDVIFAPVWTILYLMIAISFIFYFIKKQEHKNLGYIYFFIQLILNLLWAPSFFYLKNIVLALVVIIFLDIFVFLTIKKFYSISKIASMILIPYFLWIIFATYLNLGYLILNKAL